MQQLPTIDWQILNPSLILFSSSIVRHDEDYFDFPYPAFFFLLCVIEGFDVNTKAFLKKGETVARRKAASSPAYYISLFLPRFRF